MPEDLTLVTCSYNTPDITALCLKSFVFHHGKGPHQIIIIENSSEPETRAMLEYNRIPYIPNPGGTHSPSVDLGLTQARSRYALLMDTDIIFQRSISVIFKNFKRQQLTLYGEIQGNRGDFLLYPRVAPYCCFINMEHIRKAGIGYHDEQKVRESNSAGFFSNIPINTAQKDQRFYDVGAVFYESIQKNNLLIEDIPELQSYIFHAESLSWASQTGIEDYIQMGRSRQDDFYREALQYTGVDIQNCFV